MHPPQPTQGHISQGKNQTTQNNKGGNPQTGGNTKRTISYNTPPSQENATEGADTKDGSAAAGGTSGLARSDTPGRVFPHLPRQWRNSQVLHQSPKYTGPHSKDMRQRVPRWLGPKPQKTIEKQQWVFQDFCRNPHRPYAYHIQQHTRGTQDETMAETQLGTPMHPQPD